MSDYATLQGSLRSWLEASSDELGARIDDFIRIQQGWIDRTFNLQEQNKLHTITGDGDTDRFSLPDDYLELESISPSWRGRLNLVAIESFQARTGHPTRYAIVRKQIVFEVPVGDTYTVDLDYKARLDTLTAPTDTNFFLQEAYGVYLYGCLLQSVSFARGTEESTVQRWTTLYTETVKQLKDLEVNQRRTKGRRAARMGYATP